jgi:hypothetical protein
MDSRNVYKYNVLDAAAFVFGYLAITFYMVLLCLYSLTILIYSMELLPLLFYFFLLFMIGVSLLYISVFIPTPVEVQASSIVLKFLRVGSTRIDASQIVSIEHLPSGFRLYGARTGLRINTTRSPLPGSVVLIGDTISRFRELERKLGQLSSADHSD